MGKKTKIITYKANIYSSQFEEILKSNKYSDIIIKIIDENGNKEEIKSHKNILYTSSEYFKKEIEKEKDMIDIKEKDIKIFKEFLSFLYTGCFDIKDEQKTFLFLRLAVKVKHKVIKKSME
jgi:hypothetical protein